MSTAAEAIWHDACPYWLVFLFFLLPRPKRPLLPTTKGAFVSTLVPKEDNGAIHSEHLLMPFDIVVSNFVFQVAGLLELTVLRWWR